ncbi:hypothetical protein [Peromfec virus RodF8_16]|uniref:DUF5675 domain-containing protein n=1 Tax=Peromfec virus RodF8_16 TaxID=2929360 RepID=A0A976R7B5_9VIRU|nr:hypothetical protein [Peromfec virus RodF8_16]
MYLKLIRNYAPNELPADKPCLGILQCRELPMSSPVIVLDTLEPPVLAKFGRIPAGSYIVDWCMSPRFGKRTLRLRTVPGRQGILIHAGNFPSQSKGCILVGNRSNIQCRLLDSRLCLDNLHKFLKVDSKKDMMNVALLRIVEDELPF